MSVPPPPLEAKEEKPKAKETNAELAKVVQAVTAELNEAVRRIQEERTNALLAAQQEQAKAQLAQEQAAAAKRELEAAQKELALLKAARTNLAVATQLQRNFLFALVRELTNRGMVVRSLDDGRTTNRFMAFRADDGKLTLGGPMTMATDELLVEHQEQLAVLLDTINRWRTKCRKVREFKIIPSPRYGNVLSDQSLTILWPDKKSLANKTSVAQTTAPLAKATLSATAKPQSPLVPAAEVELRRSASLGLGVPQPKESESP